MENQMEEVKIDKRTREYKMQQVPGEVKPFLPEDCVGEVAILPEESDYSTQKDNPGFKLCFQCGVELPPNDSGIVVSRKYPEACYECVHRDEGFMIDKKGERVPIPAKK